jgi:hypothetical protein
MLRRAGYDVARDPMPRGILRYYLIRLEPFTAQFVELQGGRVHPSTPAVPTCGTKAHSRVAQACSGAQSAPYTRGPTVPVVGTVMSLWTTGTSFAASATVSHCSLAAVAGACTVATLFGIARLPPHCTAASHCFALHRIALHRIALHPIPSHPIALHCITSHRIASHCIALHRIALHCMRAAAAAAN